MECKVSRAHQKSRPVLLIFIVIALIGRTVGQQLIPITIFFVIEKLSIIEAAHVLARLLP